MSLTIAAPNGFHFEMEAVKTAKGTQSLGDVPILVCDNVPAGLAHWGEDGALASWDGTSFRVAFQSIARRLKLGGKDDNEIAQKQIEYKPGKRVIGASTPQSRAGNAAKKAAEKVDGDLLARLMADIASGKLSESDIGALVSPAEAPASA